jgi:rhodanese-related sulfurtransferase
MGIFNSLFGNKSAKIKDYMERGAIIVDVRSKGEYDSGAIPGSKNIPLQQIAIKASELKKLNKPIIACCASGMRSGSAASILKTKGIEAMNGGGWMSLSKKL